MNNTFTIFKEFNLKKYKRKKSKNINVIINEEDYKTHNKKLKPY